MFELTLQARPMANRREDPFGRSRNSVGPTINNFGRYQTDEWIMDGCREHSTVQIVSLYFLPLVSGYRPKRKQRRGKVRQTDWRVAFKLPPIKLPLSKGFVPYYKMFHTGHYVRVQYILAFFGAFDCFLCLPWCLFLSITH